MRQILADDVNGHEGLYAYGVAAFPANYNVRQPNYWVDVLFRPAG